MPGRASVGCCLKHKALAIPLTQRTSVRYGIRPAWIAAQPGMPRHGRCESAACGKTVFPSQLQPFGLSHFVYVCGSSGLAVPTQSPNGIIHERRMVWIRSSEPDLAGATNHRAVERMLRAAETSFALGTSCLIDLRGETGVGKTRIVHEFYRRLVVDDPYWPPTITGKNQRKAIYPHVAPRGEMPGLMWLGVPCGRESNGAPLALLEAHLPRQLEAHARGLLLRSARSEGRRAALATAAKAIVGLLGVDAINNLLDLCGHYEELRDLANDLRSEREASERNELFEVSSWVDERTVSACIDIARLLAENEIPLIVAIEDAHDADSTLLAFVRRLLVESLGTLVITTSWPTAVNAQCDDKTGFGEMLQETRASVPVLRLDIPPMETQDLQALAINRLGAGDSDDVLEDSRHLAERAAGNPLHLMLLADVAEANDILLGEGRTQDIAKLKSDFTEVLRDVWTRFLPKEVHTIAVAAALLGTPVNDHLLLASARTLAVTKGRVPSLADIESAVRLGWLLVDPDPYGDDLSIRFADPMFRVVAEDRAELVVDARRRDACFAAVENALFPGDGTRSSVRGNLASHMQARRILAGDTIIEPVRVLMTSPLLLRLAEDMWSMGRLQEAVSLAMRAAALASELLGALRLEIIAKASRFAFAVKDYEGATTVFNLAGNALLAQKARCLTLQERFEDAIDVAIDAMRAEETCAGALASIEHDFQPPLIEAAHVAVEAVTMLQAGGRNAEVAVAIADIIIAEHARGNLQVAQELCEWISESEVMMDVIDRPRVLRETGLPFGPLKSDVMPSLDFSHAGVREELATLRSDPSRAQSAAQYVSLSGMTSLGKDVLPLAYALLEVGGDDYLDIVARAEATAGEHQRSAGHYARALRVVVAHEPEDSDRALDLRAHLSGELARAGAMAQASSEAARLREIAVARGSPGGHIRACFAEATVELVAGRAAAALDRLSDVSTDATSLSERIWERRVDLLKCEALGKLQEWKAILDVRIDERDTYSFGPPFVELMAWQWTARFHLNADLAAGHMIDELLLGPLDGDAAEAARIAVDLFLSDVAASLLEGNRRPPETGALSLHTIGKENLVRTLKNHGQLELAKTLAAAIGVAL